MRGVITGRKQEQHLPSSVTGISVGNGASQDVVGHYVPVGSDDEEEKESAAMEIPQGAFRPAITLEQANNQETATRTALSLAMRRWAVDDKAQAGQNGPHDRGYTHLRSLMALPADEAEGLSTNLDVTQFCAEVAN